MYYRISPNSLLLSLNSMLYFSQNPIFLFIFIVDLNFFYIPYMAGVCVSIFSFYGIVGLVNYEN